MADDRDNRKGRRTPAGGERIPLFVEPDDDKTPVTSDPFVRLEFHQKKFERGMGLVIGEVKALHEKLDDTIRRHDDAQERDEKEHRRLSDSVNRLSKDHVALRANVNNVTEDIKAASVKLDQTTKDQALVTGQLSIALEDLRTIKRIDEHAKKVTIETQALVQRVETQEIAADRDLERREIEAANEVKRRELVAANEARRKRNAKIMQIIGGALGSGGIITAIILAVLQSKC